MKEDKGALLEVIKTTNLLKQEKKLSLNLALLLVHDLLLSRGIQAGDGPVKQAVLRHKTRISAEFTKLKIKRGVKSNEELVQAAESRAGQITLTLLGGCIMLKFMNRYSPIRSNKYPCLGLGVRSPPFRIERFYEKR